MLVFTRSGRPSIVRNVMGKDSYYDLSNYRLSSKRRKILSRLFRSVCCISCMYLAPLCDFSLFIPKQLLEKNRREKWRIGADFQSYDQVFLNFLRTRYVEAAMFLNIHYFVQFPEPPGRNQRRKMTALM